MKLEWNGIVLDVDFEDAYDRGFTGGFVAIVNKKQHAEVYKLGEFTHYDERPEFDPECDDDDETDTITTADHLICFLAAAATHLPKGTEIVLEYRGREYWFFHDLIHAEYDSGDGTDIYVDADSEQRALIMGAKLAAEHAVSIADIVRELATAENEYKERFGYETDALVSFLECCTYANA